MSLSLPRPRKLPGSSIKMSDLGIPIKNNDWLHWSFSLFHLRLSGLIRPNTSFSPEGDCCRLRQIDWRSKNSSPGSSSLNVSWALLVTTKYPCFTNPTLEGEILFHLNHSVISIDHVTDKGPKLVGLTDRSLRVKASELTSVALNSCEHKHMHAENTSTCTHTCCALDLSIYLSRDKRSFV